MSTKRPSSKDSKSGTFKDSVNEIYIRNYSVYVIYRKIIFISLISLVTAILAVCLSVVFLQQKVPPQYVQLDNSGKLLIEKPLDQKDRDDGLVLSYALNSIKTLNTYDYINIKDQLNSSGKAFTPVGWSNFMQQYGNSNTMDMVESRRMIVSSNATSYPRVIHSGVLMNVQQADGSILSVYAWKIDIPFEIDYTAHSNGDDKNVSYSGQIKQEGVVHLIVERVPSNILLNGIGIGAYNFEINK